MKLFIDTSKRGEVRVAIESGNKTYKKSVRSVQSQNVLGLIDRLLKENKLKLSEIRGIKVNTGPGSFTGLRIGVSVANALGFSLKIPVNGKKAGEVHPIYDK